MATQNLKPFQLASLDQQAHSVQKEHVGESFDVEFTRPNGAIQVVIRRALSAIIEEASASQEASRSATPPPVTPAPAASFDPAAEPGSRGAFRRPRQLPQRRCGSGSRPRRHPRRSPTRRVTRRAWTDLLREMVSSEASDLHLSADAVPVLRVHGEIRFLNGARYG